MSPTQPETPNDRAAFARRSRRRRGGTWTMLLPGGHKLQPERNWLVRIARRIVAVTPEFKGEPFLVRRDGRWNATPLLLALIAVEATDIVFAVDSAPAVLAITRATFIACSRMCVRGASCEQQRWHPSSPREKRGAAASRADKNLRLECGPTNNKPSSQRVESS
jgi:hypothetical protein